MAPVTGLQTSHVSIIQQFLKSTDSRAPALEILTHWSRLWSEHLNMFKPNDSDTCPEGETIRGTTAMVELSVVLTRAGLNTDLGDAQKPRQPSFALPASQYYWHAHQAPVARQWSLTHWKREKQLHPIISQINAREASQPSPKPWWKTQFTPLQTCLNTDGITVGAPDSGTISSLCSS